MAVLLKNRPRWLAVLSLSLDLPTRQPLHFPSHDGPVDSPTARPPANCADVGGPRYLPLAQRPRQTPRTALRVRLDACGKGGRRRRRLQLREERERERESQPGERTILAAAAAGRSSDWPKTDAPTDGQTDGERRGRGERCRHPRRKEGRNGGTSGRRWDEEGGKEVSV